MIFIQAFGMPHPGMHLHTIPEYLLFYKPLWYFVSIGGSLRYHPEYIGSGSLWLAVSCSLKGIDRYRTEPHGTCRIIETGRNRPPQKERGWNRKEPPSFLIIYLRNSMAHVLAPRRNHITSTMTIS